MDPEPQEPHDPWWMLALALVLLVLILWMLLDRTNAPEPGGVREGRLGLVSPVGAPAPLP